MEDDEISALAYDAIAYIKKAVSEGKMPTGNELGELLLYIFLEQVLIAPKLMRRVEIGNHGGFMTSESAGIHLLTADAAVLFSQVVSDTSMINGDLQLAIDSAFSEAQKLKDRKKDERRFVESNILAASFPTEIYDQLEAIILPSEEVAFKASAAIPRIYRLRFHRDIYKDLRLLEKSIGSGNEGKSNLGLFSLEMFENIAFVMAKHADPSVPDTPEEWLDGFSTFSIYQVLPKLIQLWGLNVRTQVESKKTSSN